jgi:hypothetical protein
MVKLIQSVVVICFSNCLSYGQSVQKNLWNETEIGDISVLLYRQINKSEGKTGTATIIYDNNRYYLLTAAHVAQEMDILSQVIFHGKNDKPLIKTLIELSLEPTIKWKTHKEADIAIIEIKLPTDNILKERFESLAFPLSQIYKGKELPSHSSDIAFLGYPILDLDLVYFSPLIFKANICSGLITQNRSDTKTKCTFFYLDKPSIQGCSGSGVYFSISKEISLGMGDKTLLIGIMHGTSGDNTGGKLAMITPSYYIFDLLK